MGINVCLNVSLSRGPQKRRFKNAPKSFYYAVGNDDKEYYANFLKILKGIKSYCSFKYCKTKPLSCVRILFVFNNTVTKRLTLVKRTIFRIRNFLFAYTNF